MTFAPVILAFAGLGLLCSGCTQRWEVDPSALITAGPVLQDRRLYLAVSHAGALRRVQCYEGPTGREYWQVALDTQADCDQMTVSGYRIAVACGSRTFLLDSGTGHRIWEVDADGKIGSPPLLFEDSVAFAAILPDDSVHLQIRESDTGDLRALQVYPPRTRLQGIQELVIVVSDQKVLAIQASSGAQAWQLELDAPVRQVIGSPGTLFFLQDQAIVALNPEEGRLRWSRPTQGLVQLSVLEGSAAYAEAGYVLGIEALTGREKWRRKVAGVVNPLELAHDAVYIHTAGGVLNVFSSFDGTTLWSQGIGPPGVFSTVNSDFFAWMTDTEVHAVELATRKVLPLDGRVFGRRQQDQPSARTASQNPLILDGNVLYGLDGDHRWSGWKLNRY